MLLFRARSQRAMLRALALTTSLVPPLRRRLLSSAAEGGELARLSARELRRRLDDLGVSAVGCLEKEDLVARLREAQTSSLAGRSSNSQQQEATKSARQAVLTIRESSKLAEFLAEPDLRFVAWWARWCPLCKSIMPEFDRLASGHPFRGRFAKIDVDVLSGDAERHGAERHGRRLPTFHAFAAGKRVGELKGADPEALRRFLHRDFSGAIAEAAPR
eukprot:TRINITY_DN26966_c0_g1_i3.p1 TRINITY_DN26966_c0_g1~~TRINITY_DN26966_c0_g1_i3.p1  ORF type:complete len:217 (-),score=50.77 TRINITY_DN26966_c0_g1_i3:171-821(-)